ncbi:UNVERIFIED_CONTAM: hypothetical protein FKN15_064445 [Acipenser sinensis]
MAELTSKMSQFMDVMMGQQSLLMSLTNMAPRATDTQVGPNANQPVFPPQSLAALVVQQPQGVWDVDAISRDASEGEPLLEEDRVEAELTSQHSEQDIELEVLDTNDPLWSLVERATRHLGIKWPAVELPRQSLFESPSVRSPQPRTLPAFPDFIKEVQSTWGAPASSPETSWKASAFAMQGASEAGLASFPPVDAAFAALVRTPMLSGLAKDPACPNRQCRTAEVHLKKGYSAATEAVRLSNVAGLLSVYQASLVKDLPEHLSVSLRAKLVLVAQLLVKIAQLNARTQGRSIASLVVTRRQHWLLQARVQEPDKAPLLDAPITPGHTFGPAVEEMLQRSVKAQEASQQMAKMWPHKPFQPKHQQEHQWHRTPPQHHQPRPRGVIASIDAEAQLRICVDVLPTQLRYDVSLSYCREFSLATAWMSSTDKDANLCLKMSSTDKDENLCLKMSSIDQDANLCLKMSSTDQDANLCLKMSSTDQDANLCLKMSSTDQDANLCLKMSSTDQDANLCLKMSTWTVVSIITLFNA